MGARIPRIAGDGALKCGDCLRQFAGLQTGKAKIMLNEGVGRLLERRFAQRRNSIGRLAGLEELSGQREQPRDLFGVSRLGLSRVWGRLHDANLSSEMQASEMQGSEMQGSEMQGSEMQGSEMQGSEMQGSEIQSLEIQGEKSPAPVLPP
jgi:hypothetical protein